MQQEVEREKSEVEQRLAALGRALRGELAAALDALPGAAPGPQALAESLGLDKVFCSRLLKAVRGYDPLAALYHLPGPEPLRRFYRAAGRKGLGKEAVARGVASVAAFQELIQNEVGDRSSLDAVLSAWLPQAKQEFELRRRQSAFKALSQLRGVSARCNYALVLLHPSAAAGRIDVVWVLGLFGIQRERPGARVKLATRRMTEIATARQPCTLQGESVEGLEGLRLDEFCDAAPARLDVQQRGQVVQYLLADDGFGKHAQRDLLLAEVNRSELPDHAAPSRRAYVFIEANPPSKLLLFDVLVHRDLYAGLAPQLEIYDTSFEGIVDANDPSRANDRLDFAERLEDVDPTSGLRVPEVPRHDELLAHVFANLGWDAASFRGHRCRMDYPLYGSQLVVAFGPAPELA